MLVLNMYSFFFYSYMFPCENGRHYGSHFLRGKPACLENPKVTQLANIKPNEICLASES